MSLRILVVDNYDSFVFNLVQYLGPARRRDRRPAQRRGRRRPTSTGVDGVLLQPRAGHAGEAGVSVPIVHDCAERELPLLGVCLGHQAIGVAYGGDGRPGAASCCTARPARCTTRASGVLAGLPDPFTATRYHSLAVRRGHRCRPSSRSPAAPSPAW